MQLKVIRAACMAEAMGRVRREMGGDALILATRRVADGVEITAAVERDKAVAGAEPTCDRQAAIEYHGVPPALHPILQSGPLDAALGRCLSFAELPLAPGQPPLLLVGPPGGGKTLTIARIATRLVLRGQHPMVITTDGKRAGGVEQLAALTRLLGISLTVVSQPIALSRALVQRQNGEPVFIDSAASDPFDPGQAEELAALHAVAGARTALVLPAGLEPAEAAELATAYARTGATLLIATRLDVSPRLGGILAAALAGPLTLTEAGIGSNPADGLVPLTPSDLADRLLQTRRARR